MRREVCYLALFTWMAVATSATAFATDCASLRDAMDKANLPRFRGELLQKGMYKTNFSVLEMKSCVIEDSLTSSNINCLTDQESDPTSAVQIATKVDGFIQECMPELTRRQSDLDNQTKYFVRFYKNYPHSLIYISVRQYLGNWSAFLVLEVT